MHSKGQSRSASLFESLINTASGFCVSYALWPLAVAPLFHITISHADNMKITALFTVASVLRSYVWRRIFNKR